MSGIVLCLPDRRFKYRGINYCYECKTERRVVGYAEAWHGDTETCCHCGTTFVQEYPISNPDPEGSIAEAKRRWDEIGPGRSRRLAIDEVFEDYFGPEGDEAELD